MVKIKNKKPMRYCKGCTYPEIAVNVSFDKNGYSSTYNTFHSWETIPNKVWMKRKKVFENIVKKIKKNNKSNYDCIIAVSGGKDSYYQTHVIKEYGLKPLLVTYNGNNYLSTGWYNLNRMRQVFDADHLILGPSQDSLIKLNLLGFNKMGDMNWHNHCGLLTLPIQLAVKFKIPYVIYGEPFWDISGMYKPEDFIEFTQKVRLEHGMRGFDWSDMIGKKNFDLSEKDLQWAKYPTDEEITKVGVRGLYIGNYFKWDPNKHKDLIIKKYKWKSSPTPFERTYRRFSNLDDRYENGSHDYLKFIKFGYGRATDHSSKDILTGYISREKGIEYVKKHDHVIPSDLNHWLKYVGMKKEDFYKKADTFRSNKVWWIEKNYWYKDNIWGQPKKYEKVFLSRKLQKYYE